MKIATLWAQEMLLVTAFLVALPLHASADKPPLLVVQELKLQDSIDFADCASHPIATTHVAVSLTRPDARRILVLINKGLAELRRSGDLNTILKPYGLTDWLTAKARKPAR